VRSEVQSEERPDAKRQGEITLEIAMHKYGSQYRSHSLRPLCPGANLCSGEAENESALPHSPYLLRHSGRCFCCALRRELGPAKRLIFASEGRSVASVR